MCKLATPLHWIPVLAAAALAVGSLPATSLADSVCIGSDKTPFTLPVDSSAVLGSLDARHCYAVMDRSDGRTRIWITDTGSFQGEVEIENKALAQILTDDVEMRLEAAGDPHGEVLSGTAVVLERRMGGDLALARVIEGRVAAQFLVGVDEVYPAESWPVPAADELPDAGWPVGTWPLPPGDVTLTKVAGGYNVRAEIGTPLFDVDDVLLDPAFGELRLEFLDQRDHEAKVRVIGRHLWVEGWVVDLDWRAEPPPKGWDPLEGIPSPRAEPVGHRKVGSKGAELALEPKGDAFGKVLPGAWVDVVTEDGGWLEVSIAFDGGRVRGWLEKKRLEREKKQGDPPRSELSRVAAVGLGNVVTQWYDEEAHAEEDVPLDAETVQGLAVARVAELRRLYAEALTKSPQLAGEITTKLVVDLDGVVVEQSTPVATIPDEAISVAVEGMLETMAFPEREKPRRAKDDPNLVIWIQLVFKPLGG